jgi:energy-coupling factor transporter ATP-binding protein EcfA2
VIETVPWETLLAGFKWRQGEHLAVIGPTEVGKSTLVRELLPRRSHVIFFGTKKKDDLYDKLIRKDGFYRVETHRDIKPWMKKVIIWPSHKSTIVETIAHQKKVFTEAFDMVANQGGWTCVYDECKYLAEMLGLGRHITFAQEQLRTNGGTNVSGAQRPFWIPRSVLGMASHVFLYTSTDPDDMKRLSDIGGVNKQLIRREMETLSQHEFIYIHTRAGRASMLRSQVRITN